MRIVKIHLSQMTTSLATRIGSPRFTLWQLGLLGTVIVLYYSKAPYGEALLIASLSLASMNLICAILTRTPLRTNKALLLFHVSLVALVVLAGIGQLTYLKGRLELTQGTVFTGELLESQQGVLHRNKLDTLRFENLGYEVNYRKGLKRNDTINHVAWIDTSGFRHTTDIGDQLPLILAGYRFYTSFNKGFSLLFTWQDANGRVTGNVNLPSFPAREFEQAQFWQIPNTDMKFWSQLVPKKKIVTLEQAFVLGELPDHHVVMRFNDERFEMLPGQKVDLAEGTLYYEGVRQWMGYKVFYDWTRPWMIAACLISIMAMMFYFINKFQSAIPDPQPEH